MHWGSWASFVCANAFIVFHIVLIAQIDSHKDWKWSLVFIPLWTSIVFLLIYMVWLLHRRWSNDHYGAILWLVSGVIVFVLFTVLLAIKLDTPYPSISWFGVFVPFWVGLAFFILVDEGWPDYEHKFSTETYERNADGTFERYLEVFPKQFLIAFGIFGILHTLDLENIVEISWPIRFLPFLVVTGLFILTILSNLMFSQSDYFFDVIIPFLLASPFIVFEILLLLYFKGIVHSFAVVNIPLFICDICLWFGSCVLSCTLS